MPRVSRTCVAALLLLAAACNDTELPTAPPPAPESPATDAPAAVSRRAARERLASRLAVALADPALRADFARRFAQSDAPEGKLQFQRLARADNQMLLNRLASGGGSIGELLADLDAAHNLEIYLPVGAHRESWQGGHDFMVATLEEDGEAPVAFNSAGVRMLLDPDRAPVTPVIALVPQEHNFDRIDTPAAHCYEDCGSNAPGGGGKPGNPPNGPTGLFLTGIDFDSDHESWIKGNPEFEFHVYGEVNTKPTQIACTGEHAGREYRWDTNNTHWRGSAVLLSQQDIDKYLGLNAKGVMRIVAWEDDDEACVPRANGAVFKPMLEGLDVIFKGWTGVTLSSMGSTLEKAMAAFGLIKAVRNFIVTEDDFIGHGIEASVAGYPASGSTVVLKGEGGRTTGTFMVDYRK